MIKLTIPVILAATIMVAGLFAFAPVEQASTVHTSGTVTLAADSEIDDILEDTSTTIPAEHDALPSTSEVSDIGATSEITSPATILTASADGVAYVTCSGYTQDTAADTLTVGGRTFDTIQDFDWSITVSATDAIAWVQTTADDTATCRVILMS